MNSEEDVQRVFGDCGPEGLNRQQTYTALCMLEHNPTPFEIAQFFTNKGKEEDDDDACLCCEEFQELVNGMGDPVESLKNAFAFFDKDGNNVIDREELKGILQMSAKLAGMDEEIEEDKVDEMLACCDTSGDGAIDVDELIAAWQGGSLQ